jgi:hypothetical protein
MVTYHLAAAAEKGAAGAFHHYLLNQIDPNYRRFSH